MTALVTKVVEVDDDVCGLVWFVNDLNELSKLIAVIALGQAQHAARIIVELELQGPAFSNGELYAGARGQMRIKGENEKQREVSRYHRDGFLFECISWITARQTATDRTFLKDPHISSTTQGLDGLSITLHPDEPVVVGVTIFEDKCTENPRNKFRDEIMPTFTEHHENKRSRDLVANAVSLIREGGINGTEATRAAARVLDKQYRTYQAALTVGSNIATVKKRKNLFKGYNDLMHITRNQRIGATFLIDGDLRDWFQELANQVITRLNEFEAEDV